MMNATPDTLLEEVSAFIKNSRRLLENGELAQLAGMDDQMRELCDGILRLSVEERAQYAERLQSLFQDLEQLSHVIQNMRDATVKEASQLSHHKKAHVAYRTAESSDQLHKKDKK